MAVKSNVARRLEPLFDRLGKLTRLQRILICVGALVVIVVPFTWFSFLPKMEKIDMLEEEKAQLESRLEIAKRKAVQLRRYQALLKEAKENYKEASRKLPQAKEIPDLLANITASGQETGLEFVLFDPQDEALKDFYAEIPVAIEVSGTYRDVVQFFDKLARLSRIVNLRNISMSPQKADKLNTSCTAVTYRFIEGT
jgi:type IV pilus assembly protein PilO